MLEQYAIAKRAQVTLNSMWAALEPTVSFLCMHPGWVDTPGVRTALPKYVLRSRATHTVAGPRFAADALWMPPPSPYTPTYAH